MMAMDDFEELAARCEAGVAAQARRLVEMLGDIRPDLQMRVARGWGTVNFHHPDAGFVVALYLKDDHVSLIFQDGRLLDSPLLVDDGKVRRVRWIPFRAGDTVPLDDIAILLAEAVALRSGAFRGRGRTVK